MGLHAVLFPDDLSYETRGGPGFNTSVVDLPSGESYRVSRYTQAKRRYNAKYAIKTHVQAIALNEFYIARDGVANTFLFKDWFDYATTPSHTLHNIGDVAVTGLDEEIGVGDGVTTQFQLKKTYNSGFQTKTRTLRFPKAGTVKVRVNGAALTEGTHFTVATSTGLVTILTPPPDTHIVTAGCELYVPVKFDKEIDDVLALQADAFDVESYPDVPMSETNNDVATDEEVPMRGGSAVVLPINTSYDYSMGCIVALLPLVDGVEFYLPPIEDLAPGGPHLSFRNESPTNDVEIWDFPGGTLLMNAGPSHWAQAYVYLDGSTLKWQLFGSTL